MSFLVLQDGKVLLTDEGKMLVLVQKLQKADRTQDKKWFNDMLKGLYFIYKPETMFDELEHETKILEVSSKMLERPWREHIKNKDLKQLAKFYQDTVTTQNMRNLRGMETDMEIFKRHISKIPMEKSMNIDRDVEYVDDNGEKRTARIQKRLTVINSDEKQMAYKALLDMQRSYNQLKELTKEETNKIKVNEKKKRLFESRKDRPYNV
jgi:ketosteroid isomerase-like protein